MQGSETDDKRKNRGEHVDAYSLDTYSHGEGKEQIEGAIGIFYTILFFLFVVASYYLASIFLHIFSFLDAKVSNKFILAQFVALVVLGTGIILYFLREQRRMMYALLELAFAIVTGGAAIYRLKEGDLSVWLALGASTYLVVRSLENMQKAGFTFIDTCNSYVSKRLLKGEHVSAKPAIPSGEPR